MQVDWNCTAEREYLVKLCMAAVLDRCGTTGTASRAACERTVDEFVQRCGRPYRGDYVVVIRPSSEALARSAEDKDEGVAIIAAERQRQIEREGYTPDHDDTHTRGQLTLAARDYTYVASEQMRGEQAQMSYPAGWPWEPRSWKPSADPIRNLAKAGALLAAEIGRLKRAAPPASAPEVEHA